MSGVAPANRSALPVPGNLMIETVSLSTASMHPIGGHFVGVTSRGFGTGSPALVNAATSPDAVAVFRIARALGALDWAVGVRGPHAETANAVIRIAAVSRPLMTPTLADGNQVRLIWWMAARCAERLGERDRT